MDSLAMILLTIPIFYPIVIGLDFWGMPVADKSIWFGILALMVVEIGLVHPPVGMNIYIINKIAKDVPLMETFKGVMPFLGSDLLRIILILIMKNKFTNRLALLTLLLAAGAASLTPVWAQSGWPAIEQAARGQTVFWNAWAGSEQTNAYLQWVAQQVQASFGVKLQHVKITDTADVVKRVRAEKAAGRTAAEGTVDLVWINGENFLTMKREGLLFGPFAEGLPGYSLVDVLGKPTTRLDFSEPVDGLE
eukprot:gene48504-65065_t